MGSLVSLQDLPNDPLIGRLSSVEHIPDDDSFWNELLSSAPRELTLDEEKTLFERLKPVCKLVTANNCTSGNLSSLLRIFLSKTSELLVSPNKADPSCCSHAYNALIMLRCFTQHLVHKYPEKEILRSFEAQGGAAANKRETSEPPVSQLIESLIDIIIHIPVTSESYLLHCEAVNTLLVLLSVQLFTTESSAELVIHKYVFESKQAEQMCGILVSRFVNPVKVPSNYGGSIILDIAVDLLGLFITPPENEVSPLTRNSVLLCIVLINNVSHPNVFRNYMSSISDVFDDLYKRICVELNREDTTLILYHLLHRNNKFRTYVLEQEDTHSLVLPMLHTIYNASDNSCRHIYMSLIVLLILTEDSEFNKKVHLEKIKSVPWYTDRTLPEISLGGLIILVTARTVQYNLLKLRDEYLHTNCLAALANMSSQFVNLHPYVCQRLVGLFEILAKTYNRAKQELVAIEKALRIILEVMNSCLSNQLVHNSNLVYTLLYKRNIFDSLKNHVAFQDIINNIEQVLEYFSSKLDKIGDGSADVDTVLSIIVEASPKWPSHRLQKFPELKFKYVEEEKPEEFFVPYVWSLVTTESRLYWNKEFFKNC